MCCQKEVHKLVIDENDSDDDDAQDDLTFTHRVTKIRARLVIIYTPFVCLVWE